MFKEIKGVLPVILMPYDDAFNVHEEDFIRQAEHLIEVGCDGFVIGQVSELLRLTTHERFRIAELSVEAAKGRCITVMSTGGESIKSAVEFSKQAESVGIDALLVMHPSIMALQDDEMFRYFAQVIEAVDIPVIIHHAKSLAKRPLSIEVQAQLLHQYGAEKVLFKPESSPTPPRLSQLRDATDGQAQIFEGDGGMMLLDCYKRGLKGSIPATETAEIMITMWDLLQKEETEKARQLGHGISYLMCQMMNSIDCYAAIAKHFLKQRGLITNTHVRPPIDYKVDPESLREAEQTYNHLLQLANQLKAE
ncbi:MAG: dihydrodipicolinate synthase family protein [Legionellaceae bacterium]|nr:dihydrodipicolinate synthase family protein [Legionellaceae bacterium]|tara:strand:- start:726 stop:1646 length:921 start_codon:yes stop_codon:yes gene_type:complete